MKPEQAALVVPMEAGKAAGNASDECPN